jgi:hypothetical protein
MPIRRLRIIKISPSPVIGICECCISEFKSDKHPGDDAEKEIAAAFDAHNCELVDSSQNVLRIVPESTDDK